MFEGLRVLAMLRRIAKALEEQNRISRESMDREFPQHRQSRKFVISQPTTEEWNERHKRESEGIR